MMLERGIPSPSSIQLSDHTVPIPDNTKILTPLILPQIILDS